MSNKVCGKYRIVDFERILVAHVEDLPIESCQGMFGFSTGDIAPVLNWTRDRIKDGKQCQAAMAK